MVRKEELNTKRKYLITTKCNFTVFFILFHFIFEFHKINYISFVKWSICTYVSLCLPR